MDENNKLRNVEAFLKIRNDKTPLALYSTEETKPTSSSSTKVLKPREVIATVSKQLRDIQKADTVRHVTRNVKPKHSDFVPINVLCTPEHIQLHDINKFETQCVTDSQLIDIVDNVEASVNVNIANHQVNQETSASNCCNSIKKITDEGIENVRNVNNVIKKGNTNQDFEDTIQLSDQNEQYIDDVNIDVYKEFDMSYSLIQDKKSSEKCNTRMSKQQCNSTKSRISDVVDSIQNSAEHLYKEVGGSSLYNVKEAKEKSLIEKCNKYSNIARENHTPIINEDNKDNCLHLKDIPSHKVYTDFTMESIDGLPIEAERSSSPIFPNYKPTVKTKTLSPLIYPLDTFEKFESLAMPLFEENIDFEAAKHLINSQIIDNQLLISSNTAPTLKKSTDNILCNSNNIETKVDKAKTLMQSKQIENKSTSFEDEILFSSDEESEYLQCFSKDLPLTCALKTSFYGPEVNLDETIFVGFQTSSDKCIQVSKDSFVKAKQLFNSIDKEKNDNLTLTELVDIYDSKYSNNNVQTKEVFNNSYKNDNENVNDFTNNVPKQDVTDNDNVLKKEEFIGFKTANGKMIKISEKALRKCNTVFKDIDGDIGCTAGSSNMVSKRRENISFKTTDNKRIKFLENSLEDTRYNSEEIYLNLNKIPLHMDTKLNNTNEEQIQTDAQGNQSTPICGELMATVKPNVNDDYMSIEDKVLIEEFENESIEEHKQIECNVLQMVVNKISENSFNDKQCFGNSDLSAKFDPGISEYPIKSNSQDVTKYCGFKTANNKEIKISNEALVKTKNLFHDIGFEDMSEHKRNTVNTFGCNFDNEDVTEPVYDTDNYSAKCDSELNFYQAEHENDQPIFQSFKTASNKVVPISKEALLKSKKMFQDIDSINICKDDKSPKSNDDSAKFLYKTEKKSIKSFPFRGFQTASNKRVNVSEEAIAKTKKVFQDLLQYDVNDNIGKSTHFVHDIEDNVGKVVNIPNSKLEPSKFVGFKTANNKSIVVSEESFLKTRKIFESIADIDDNKDLQFKTAEYMNSYTTVKETHKNDGNALTSEILGLPTFKTANNKQVAISNEALAKAKLLYKDVECKNNISQSNEEITKVDYWEAAIENPIQKISEFYRQEPTHNVGVFKGFQTASNKTVKVSDEAIARSRKIFDEINFDVPKDEERKVFVTTDDINKENVEILHENSNMPPVIGLKAVSKKSTTISEGSFNKSKQLFSGLGNDFKKANKNVDMKTNKISSNDTANDKILHTSIDTQILNNFEETLHTEDFYNDTTPKQCKRSGSPILLCPKAKRRKRFETPYRTDIDTGKIQNVTSKANKKPDVENMFSEDYKKTKLYSLKDLDKMADSNLSTNIDSYILNFDFETLLKFEFEGHRNDVTHTMWTTDNIKAYFTEYVDRKIIPDGWLDNHLKLILWKLISYEIRFPNIMRGVCSVKNVLDQLKYRYDKELYRVERPALRKLLEKDDISTKTMILTVVAVYVNGTKVSGTTTASTNVELLLTDGWYCVKACPDRMLSRLVSEGKISVGRKIATVGAELLNCEQGVSPWEDISAVRLKIFGNSTRPARWDARLGFHAKGTILSQLSTIDPSGGKVCKTRALVLRVYPALYVEKLEDGSTVTRSERLEHLHQIKYESERQIQLEKVYEEVEKEFFDQESSGSEGMDVDLKKNLQSGSQLNRLMKKCNDPSEFRSHLTDSQAQLLQEYSSRSKEKIVEELQKRVQDKIRAQGVQLGRNVIPLLKIRVAGLEGEDRLKVSKAMVSIWRPNDAIQDVVKEGTWIDLFNIVPTAVRNGEVQISAGRQSLFHRSKFKENDKMKPYIESLQRRCFTTKNLNKNPTIQTEFNEIDTAGIVFLIEPSLNDFERIKGQQFQNVYLTDVDKNFICINFWGGIKKFGYENIFDTGNVVACMNLQKRAGNTRKTIPQFRATELTVFTKTPKLDHLRTMTSEIIKKLSGLDKRKFCEDCILIKNNYATIKNGSEFSPYRLNTSEFNLSRNKIFIDSPLVQNRDINLNLTGLDFESTFQQTDSQDISPAVLKQKQITKEKIAKLKQYGEPPPLSKIHIINKSINAGSAYKSPLTSYVARVKKSDSSPLTRNETSPVLSMNRTYVVKTGMNPVKLNFSSSLNDEKTEPNPFEEEFDASPPLSLE